MSDKNSTNILKYKKRWSLNIGITVFGIIFLYLIITVFIFVTEKHVSVYEVRTGTILKDQAYSGLVLREESVITCDTDGYITYYIPENTKAAVGTNIYSITPEKALPMDTEPKDSEQPIDLSSEERSSLQLKVKKFNQNFNEQDFSTTYQLKTEIENTYQSVSNQNTINQLNQMIANGDSAQYRMAQAPDDGIITYYVDGYEGLKFENLTAASFDKSNYTKEEFVNNQGVTAGKPVYKLITNEEWSIVVPLSKKIAEQLTNQTIMKVRILKDNELMWANINIQTIGKQYYGILSFNNSMIRYDTERFLDVELIMEDQTGLKIPKTSKISKEFYVVPKSYIKKNNDDNESGVLLQSKSKKKKTTTIFKPLEIYSKSEDDMCYLDAQFFEDGDSIMKPNTNEVLVLSDNKKKLDGVYNINKGYADFQLISILCESDEYFIIDVGTDYGLSNYDYIVLEGNTVKENDVVFR